MRRFSIIVLLAVTSAAGPTRGEGEVLVDRVVAVVDEDPILLSGIRRVVGLGLVEVESGESQRQLERRVLDGLIDQRLHLHEVERHDFSQLPADEIDAQVERIRANFTDQDDLRLRLDRLGLDDEGLRLLVARQLRVLLYVEKRLGPRVFINPDDVRAYYDDVLAVEMRRLDRELPALETVREQTRDLLYEQRLNEEIEAWTEELRLEADVVDYLDRVLKKLPPVIERIE